MITKKRITGFLSFALIVAAITSVATYTVEKSKIGYDLEALTVSSPALIQIGEQGDILDDASENIVVTASTRAAMVKWERDKSRSQEKENVTRIIQDDMAKAEEVEKYQKDLLRMIENGRKEAEAEAILKALGFADVVVNLSDLEISANVLIFGNELDENSVMKIGSSVEDSTGIPIQKIYIVDNL